MLKTSKAWLPYGIFTKSDIANLRNLAQNKDLIITKPDKGRGVVVSDKTDYVSKMNSILSDTDKI